MGQGPRVYLQTVRPRARSAVMSGGINFTSKPTPLLYTEHVKRVCLGANIALNKCIVAGEPSQHHIQQSTETNLVLAHLHA